MQQDRQPATATRVLPVVLIVVALIVAFAVAPVGIGAAEAGSRLRIEPRGSSMGVGSPLTGPVPVPHGEPPGAAGLERDHPGDRSRRPSRLGREPHDETRKPRPEPDPDEHFPLKPHQHPFLFLDRDDDDEDRIIVVPAPAAEPEEPEEAASVEPPAPPDPRGPRFVPARGAAGEPPYRIGEPLPEGVPFVTLDWAQYRLPRPPRGLIYARVGSDVLLIDPATRRVERRVDPAELQAAQGRKAPESE